MDEYEYITKELTQREMYTSDIRNLVCLQKLVSYQWNAVRLSEKEREAFLLAVQPELQDFSKECSLYADLTDSQKESVELLRNRTALRDHLNEKQERSRQLGKLFAKIEQGEKFVLVSAGRYGERMLLLQEMSGIKCMKAVADNNHVLQGKIWNGYSIISVSEAVQKYKSGTFIIANRNHSDKIQKQLENMGISSDKIFAVSNMLSFEEMLGLVFPQV